MKHLNIFLSLASLIISLSTIEAQTLVVVDPDNYKTESTPFVVPSLQSGSTLNLIIKRGESIFITFSGIDPNSGVFYRNKATSRTEIGTVLQLKVGDSGGWLINYTVLGNSITIGLDVNYQTDIFDRTIGSSTFGKLPDFIWVNAGGNAKVSGGPNFGYYKWKSINDASFVGDYADSTRLYNQGIYVGRLNDIANWTNDTITILEKPTLNNTTKTLNFPTTTVGITYKLLNASNINGTDTTWTDTQSFVGDGNAKNITLTDGKYKLTTTFGIHTAVYPYGYFLVGITTAIDKTNEENINYRLVDNNLQFDNEVNMKFFSLQGQLLQQGEGQSFHLNKQTGIIKATDKNGNALTVKIISK
ncbi:MAG: hypothetical protein QM751_10845 [Paludibacteraceae bacterium]